MKQWPKLTRGGLADMFTWLGKVEAERLNDVKEIDRLYQLAGPTALLHAQYTPVANSGAAETDLMRYDVPSAALSRDGHYFEFDFMFAVAGNANSKRVRLYANATLLYDSGAVAQVGGFHRIRLTLIRTAAGTQRYYVETVDNGAAVALPETITGTTTAFTTEAITLKATGQGAATSDIFQYSLTAKWFPAAAAL